MHNVKLTEALHFWSDIVTVLKVSYAHNKMIMCYTMKLTTLSLVAKCRIQISNLQINKNKEWNSVENSLSVFYLACKQTIHAHQCQTESEKCKCVLVLFIAISILNTDIYIQAKTRILLSKVNISNIDSKINFFSVLIIFYFCFIICFLHNFFYLTIWKL